MTNKKSQDLLTTAIILATITLIVLFLLVAIFTGRLPFTEQGFCISNPDECVCNEWDYIDFPLPIQISNYCETAGLDLIKCIDNEIKEHKKDYRNECISYHRKTPQELEIDYCNENPEDGGRCICIERIKLESYEEELIEVILGIPCDKVSKEDYEICIQIGDFLLNKSNWKCIKARSKNECEKGNPD